MTQDYKIILTALDQTRPAFEQVQRSLGGMESMVKSFGLTLGNMQSMVKSVGLGLAGLGAGATFGVLVSQFNKVIDSAAGLKEMAERTGSTVEQMGSLSRAAKLTGNDIALVETGVIKLTKSLFATGDESSATGRALQSIGLSVKQLQQLDPAEAFRLVAQNLNGFKDSADKTAVAMALFGKNGAQLLPFIKDLGELGEINTKVTREQAEAADQYQKNLLRLTAASGHLYKTISMELLPVLNELSSAMVEGQKNSAGMITGFGMWVGSKLIGPAQMVKNLREELQDLDEWRQVYTKAGWDASKFEEKIRRANAALEQAKYLEREQALGSNPAANEDANDVRLRQMSGKKSIDFKPPEPTDVASKVATRAANDPLSDAAKSYGSVMSDLSQAQTTAMMSGMELTATQRRLVAVMSSPEWLKMPEPWRALVAAQGEAAIAAEQTAAAQKRLNDLIAATPTAKLEAQRETMQFLAKAFEDGKISAEQFQEASQAALGTLPDLAKDGENAFAELQRTIEGWGRDSASAIVDFATTGKLSFSGMIESMIKDLMRMIVYQNITKPLASAVSGGLPGLGSFFGGGAGATPPPIDFAYLANGGVAQSPSLSAYSGGVYDSPRMFAFARGAGIFGEAGPEAIMPLQRGRDGKLGVAASGGGGGDVTVNVTVAADGTTRNDGPGNLAALGSVIAGAVRAELINQKRPGGLLAA